MVGKDLIMATLLGSDSGSSGSGGGIPQEDIDAAFAALAEKGVTVPDGATSADLDDLIKSIVTGGGATLFGRAVETGTFVPATTVSSMKVMHSLGTPPTGAIWWTEADALADTANKYAILGAAIAFDSTNWYGVSVENSKENAASTSSTSQNGLYKTPTGRVGGVSFSPTGGASTEGSVYNLAKIGSVTFQAGAGRFVAGVEYKYILLGGIPQ